MNENNENATGWSRSKWKVRKTLERNRTLLRSLREQASVAEEDANAWLVRRGFDFEYHTHVLTTLEGKLVVMCYDEGYTLDRGGIQPWPHSRNSTLFAAPSS